MTDLIVRQTYPIFSLWQKEYYVQKRPLKEGSSFINYHLQLGSS